MRLQQTSGRGCGFHHRDDAFGGHHDASKANITRTPFSAQLYPGISELEQREAAVLVQIEMPLNDQLIDPYFDRGFSASAKAPKVGN